MIENRKAKHDFEILERFIAGIVLLGAEVKSINQGKVSLKDSFISLKNKEVFWKNGHMTIPNYVTMDRPEEKRDRKLLLTKKEIRKLTSEVEKYFVKEKNIKWRLLLLKV